MSGKKTYQVEIQVLDTYSFTVEDVNSPDEAEEVAQQLLGDSEEAEQVAREIYSIDCYPIDSKEDI